MKKIITLFGLIVIAFGMNAQNTQIQNKKGVDLLPIKGEFAIGINALPALIYVGNLFGKSDSNNALAGNKFVSPFASNTLFGKYMLTDNTAIRAHLRVAVDNNTYLNNLDEDGQIDPAFVVTDAYKTNFSLINVGAGYEWRRGKSRLRALYGGEIFYQLIQQSEKFTYGNPMPPGGNANSTVWSNNGSVLFESGIFSRELSTTGGNYNGVGIRAFGGLEYFIAPKICIGTEFGWGGKYGKTGNTTTEFEYTTGVNVAYNKIVNPGASSLNIDNDNFNGAIYFMFYF